MPIYEYECETCNLYGDASNSIDERHTHAPLCPKCADKMSLVISPVRGVVKFPAAGGHEYVSPATGRVITSERARRDDLKRSGCRPYEGFEQEMKHANKIRAEEEKQSDAKLHENVSRAYYALSPEKRKVLRHNVP